MTRLLNLDMNVIVAVHFTPSVSGWSAVHVVIVCPPVLCELDRPEHILGACERAARDAV